MTGSDRESLLARSRLRRRSGGTVVFVVTTTLALMAAMGVYAMTAASQEVKVSGYMRQSTQAHYLTEMSLNATAGYVDRSTAAVFVRMAKGDFNGATDFRSQNCISSAPIASPTATNLAKSCKRFVGPELQSRWCTSTACAGVVSPLVPGFGAATKQTATIWAELTNFVPLAPPPGFDTNSNMQFVKGTVTTGGVINNTTAATATPELGRGRIIVGPVPL